MSGNVPWQEFYRAAMLELDPIKLRQRIEEAHAAIQGYREDPTGSAEERQEMADALDNLRALLKIEFKPPRRTADSDCSSERVTV